MNHKKKYLVLIVSVVLLCCIAVGGTLAYLFTEAGPLENKFVPTQVTTEVDEEIEYGVKTYVKIKNTSEISAYIRAMVVVTWQNEDGEIFSTLPVQGTDYVATYNETDWFLASDGFYYHKVAVASKASTEELIMNCKQLNAPEGYKLCVEIIGSGIQSEPAEAVESAWPAVKVVDGKLEANTPSAG